MTKSIIVCGSIAQKPSHGGHTWVFLQYILGFRKLGWNVFFIDQLQSDVCVTADGGRCSIEESVNLQYFVRVMDAFGLTGAYALICDSGELIGGIRSSSSSRSIVSSSILIPVSARCGRHSDSTRCSPGTIIT
jgi:hypothetical protein